MDKIEFRRLMAGWISDISDKQKVLVAEGLVPEYINNDTLRLIKHLAYELLDE